MNLNAHIATESLPGKSSSTGDKFRLASAYRSPLERLIPLLLCCMDFLIWWSLLDALQYILQGKIFHFSIFSIPIFITILIIYLIGGYDRRTEFLNILYASEHLVGLIIAAVLSALFIYIFSAYQEHVKPSRALIPSAFTLFALISWLMRRAAGLYLQSKYAERPIVILGGGEKVKRFCRDYAASQFKWPLKIFSICADGEEKDLESINNPILSGDLIADGTKYEGVLLACSGTLHFSPSLLQWLITLHCSNVPVLTVEAFHEKHWRRVNIDGVNSEWLFNTEFRLARNSVYSQLKRICDIVGAVFGLIVLSPLFFILCLLIYFENCGGIIFRQQRVGREGRIFNMYKFRTMCENHGDIYTHTGDSRITRLGYWLRKMRLDELPQLWNVLKGDMSLIGPRAEWVRCAEIYKQEVPYYHLRHLVNPGITGWAQVNFSYGASKEDAIEKFQFDLYYIRHFSLLLDISIVLKTIHIMLVGKGR